MSEQQNSKYPSNFPDGFYRAKLIGHALAESKEKGTPYIALKIELLKLNKAKDGKSYPGLPMGAHKYCSLWLTERTIDKAKNFLLAAGFTGKSLQQLNPDHPRHASLIGYEFDVSNRKEQGSDGKLHDRFDVAPGNNSNKWMNNLKSASSHKVMMLDALWNSGGQQFTAPAPKPTSDTPPWVDNPPAAKQQKSDDDWY